MKLMKVAAALMFSLFIAIACGGDGSDGGSGSGSGSGSGGLGGSGGGSNPTELIGTWDLGEIQGGDDEGPVPPGTVTVVLTDTTFSVTEPSCVMSGTYTATSTTITTTTTNTSGSDCGPHEVSTMTYTVNSTTFTLADDTETMIFSKQ